MDTGWSDERHIVGKRGLLLLAAVLAPLAAQPEEDASRARQAEAMAKDVTPASPGSGSPSYDETIEWLGGHLRLHESSGRSTAGVRIVSRVELSASKWPCVIREEQKLVVMNRETDDRFQGTHVYLVSLRLMNVASVEVSPLKDGRGFCVHMKGSDGFAIVQKDPSAPLERRNTDSLCLDTQENAERAAKALRHAGTLCGASQAKEPF